MDLKETLDVSNGPLAESHEDKAHNAVDYTPPIAGKYSRSEDWMAIEALCSVSVV